jgi:hypothetical protein
MKSIFPFLFILLFFSLCFSIIYFKSYREAINNINFIVSEVIPYPTKAVVLKSKDKEYSFASFSIYVDDKIEVGDRVVKEKCSRILYIYRKDTMGKEVLFKSIEMGDSFFNYRC